MKLLSLFLASTSFAQDDGSDKWVGYDYGGYSYGSYDTGLDAKFVEENADFGRAGNGLMCFTCHGRLDLGSAESTANNAWFDCVDNGEITECWGDQRSCLTEERRRYDTVVEVKSMCKNPEACAYQWRRNERYMPMFHLFGDQFESANPGYFDDECIISGSDRNKHGSMRSQWESTCRVCCAATTGLGCNGPDTTAGAGMPMALYCDDVDCTGASLSGVANFGNGYSIEHLPAFMDDPMHHDRAHPGEGRNSAPEDKFVDRQDAAGGTLREQADQLSTEDTDFHNDRAALGSTVLGSIGAFGT